MEYNERTADKFYYVDDRLTNIYRVKLDDDNDGWVISSGIEWTH